MHINIRLYEHHWWVLILKGLLAIIFGGISLLEQKLPLMDLLIYFGLIVLFSGIFTIVASLFHLRKRYWDISLMEGAFDVLFALLVLVLPSLTTQAAYIALGVWGVLVGIVQLRTALRIKSKTSFWLVFGFNAVISFCFAIFLFFHPIQSEQILVRIVEVFLVILGVSVIFGAIKLRLIKEEIAKDLDKLANS